MGPKGGGDESIGIYLLVDEHKSVEQILSKDGARVHIENICLVRPDSKLLDSLKREIMSL